MTAEMTHVRSVLLDGFHRIEEGVSAVLDGLGPGEGQVQHHFPTPAAGRPERTEDMRAVHCTPGHQRSS